MDFLYKKFIESSGVNTDTRTIQPGQLFFALKGPNFNANEYAVKAIEAGAAYAVVDEIAEAHPKLIKVNDVLTTLQQMAHLHRSHFKFPVIGITGSNGKTTNKELLNAVLSTSYNVLATKGNYNNHIGVPLTLLRLNADHDMAIIEMGANHAGEIKALCLIADPNYGLITSIGIAHLEGFGSVETIKETKKALYDHVIDNGKYCFVNNGLDQVPDLYKGSAGQAVYYGEANDFIHVHDHNAQDLLALEIKDGDTVYACQTQLAGAFHANNVLNSYVIGRHFNVPPDKIVAALEGYVPANNRSQLVHRGSTTIILDAYNANPSSMDVAVSSFQSHPARRKIVILGDMLEMGDASLLYHQALVDKLEAADFDAIVLVGHEFLQASIPSHFHAFETTKKAKAWWSAADLEDTTVLIKGSRGIALEAILKED